MTFNIITILGACACKNMNKYRIYWEAARSGGRNRSPLSLWPPASDPLPEVHVRRSSSCIMRRRAIACTCPGDSTAGGEGLAKARCIYGSHTDCCHRGGQGAACTPARAATSVPISCCPGQVRGRTSN